MKNATITLRISKDLKEEMDFILENEKSSQSEFIREALNKYISLKKFYYLRKKVLPYAESKGFLTDEDIFKNL
ncbi:MAG: ribbon-helix-helix domain-containing protein [Candidatus Acidulodesulfobacterium sp.]